MELECKIKTITFLNKENTYTVMQVKDNNHNYFTATGIFPDITAIGEEKAVGLEVELEGNWVRHKKYGKQFNFSKIKVKNTGLLFFLANIVKGLGKNLAKQLIDHYGEKQLVDIIENNPEKLTEFKGIKEKKMRKIVTSWNKYKAIRELTDFFATREANITSNMILRIYKHFHEKEQDPVKVIRQNPYSLTEIMGIGFKTADNIALQLGIDEYSPLRIKALIDYILLSEASDNGHTYLTIEQLNNKAVEYIYNEEGRLTVKELKDLIKQVLHSNAQEYHFDGEIVALNTYKRKETLIKRFIMRRLAMPSPFKISDEQAKQFIAKQEKILGFKLSKEQYNAVFNLTTKGYPVFILCGYAGTGKSTISKVILNFFSQFIPKDKITCCAFTGMASKRIRETTSYHSSTIHSLLGFSGEGFNYNQDNPLPYKVVLLDEASMVNVDIFNALVRALPNDAIFIMVGDDAQLPPIGAGNVFTDLLKYKEIPKVKLTEIHRQSRDSVLTYFASYIRQGEVPNRYTGIYKDWEFYKMDINGYLRLKKELSEKELKEIRDDHYEKMLGTLIEKIFETIEKENLKGLRRVWDIQAISPMRHSSLGTKNLNKILQDKLNNLDGKQVDIRGYTLKQYDKVIHLKNQNMQYITLEEYKAGLLDSPSQTRIYNGALGLVLDINEEDEEFYVLYPGDNQVAIYSFDDYKNNIDLGYALTIHKVQGNQFNYVFMPLTNSFYIMLNSKLIYTAVTRAIKRIFIIAQTYAFKRACENTKETVRQTFLSKGDFELVMDFGLRV